MFTKRTYALCVRRIVRVVAAILSTLVFSYSAFVRPRLLRWGATENECDAPWPGDRLVAGSAARVTRAITIRAPAKDVWPWIVQIGQNRAGFYTYPWLEAAAGAPAPRVERIDPRLQHRSVGDTVWLTSPGRFGNAGRLVVALLVPERAMILTTPSDAERAFVGKPVRNGTWGFILDEGADGTTRLILRSLSTHPALFPLSLAYLLLLEPARFFIERKMLSEIKRLAERSE